jgi:hypothetical protein
MSAPVTRVQEREGFAGWSASPLPWVVTSALRELSWGFLRPGYGNTYAQHNEDVPRWLQQDIE